MKKYTIERTDPVHGRVMERTINGDLAQVVPESNYYDCMKYVKQNQKELKVYKIARTLRRKNGKRRLVASIYAEDNNEAVHYFDNLIITESDAAYQLLTGDWKIIAHFMVVNNVRGTTILN